MRYSLLSLAAITPRGSLCLAAVWLAGCATNPFQTAPPAAPLSLEPPPGVAAPAHTLPQAAALQTLPSYADLDGRQLESALVRSREESQVMQDEIAALRDQLASTSTQLAQVRSAGMPPAATTAGGAPGAAASTPTATMQSAVAQLALPDLEPRFDGAVVRIDIPADRIFDTGTANLLPGGAALLTQVATELERVYPGPCGRASWSSWRTAPTIRSSPTRPRPAGPATAASRWSCTPSGSPATTAADERLQQPSSGRRQPRFRLLVFRSLPAGRTGPYTPRMTTIVDYGSGNLRSVQKALERCGTAATITSEPAAIAAAERLVLPGVGAFGDAMRALHARGLIEPIRRHLEAEKPFLGICMGLQLLFETGLEGGRHEGLGILPGEVVRFDLPAGMKVPHKGWNTTRWRDDWRPAADGEHFYFVHSFYARPADDSVVAAVTDYGGDFCAAVRRGNLFATQFHPEKSQAAGLRLLATWLESSAPLRTPGT